MGKFGETENADGDVFRQGCVKPLREVEDKIIKIDKNKPILMTPIGSPLTFDGMKLKPIHGTLDFCHAKSENKETEE